MLNLPLRKKTFKLACSQKIPSCNVQLSSQSLCFTGKKTVLEVQCYPWFLCTWLYLSSVWLTWIHYQLKNNNDAVFFVIHAFVLLLHKYEIWLHQSCKHNNPPPSFQSTTNSTPHTTEFVAFRSGLKGWHTLQRMAIHSSLFFFVEGCGGLICWLIWWLFFIH